MEMFYFTLGFLTIFALIIIGVLIVGMIKLYKLNRDFQNEKLFWSRELENLYRHFDNRDREWRDTTERMYRDVEKKFEDSVSYTDKRIDKTINQKKEN